MNTLSVSINSMRGQLFTKVFFSAFLALGVKGAFAQDSYVCIPDKATGFQYKPATKSWEPTNFSAKSENRLLKKKADGWEWINPQSKEVTFCGQMFGYGVLQCQLREGNVMFDSDSKNYVESYLHGYAFGGPIKPGRKNETNSTYLVIGKCIPL